jgi:uncharacterized protein
MRVFLDANILFSAAQQGSPVRQLLDVLGAHAELATSQYAITEAERNVAAKRPAWLQGLRAVLTKVVTVDGQADCRSVPLNESDQPILGAASAATCTHIMTGDLKHFGPLMGRTVLGVTVVSTRMMAEHMARRGWIVADGSRASTPRSPRGFRE